MWEDTAEDPVLSQVGTTTLRIAHYWLVDLSIKDISFCNLKHIFKKDMKENA